MLFSAVVKDFPCSFCQIQNLAYLGNCPLVNTIMGFYTGEGVVAAYIKKFTVDIVHNYLGKNVQLRYQLSSLVYSRDHKA